MVKRRLMETQGGEVRRLHIIYYLNRNGRDEHPHLIRIHHLSRNGVRLRDIKGWLGELRGKDMPESFAWSYKRKYKTGYVWQDILDDDLVTPISDNEYVIKGSEISPTNDNIDYSIIPMQKEQSSLQESAKQSQRASCKEIEPDIHSSISSNSVSSKTSSSVEESSPSFGSETSKNSSRFNQEANSPASDESAALLSKEKKRKTNKLEIISAKTVSKTTASSDKPHYGKSRSSGGILKNLITCGGVDTNDSVVMMSNKRYKPLLKSCSCDSAVGVRDSAKEKGEYKERTAPRAAYRPLYGPKCSICGKTFKPEKLQSHMYSCKGMKALAKGSNPAAYAARNISKTSTASTNEDPVSAYLLTQNC